QLIGISSVKMAFTPQGVPTQGLGFGIPASVVRDKIEEFKHPQKVPVIAASNQPAARRYFGLELQDLTHDLTDALGVAPDMGVLVTDVKENSPAESAGFKRGLVIYKIGRYDINSTQQVETLLANVKPGTDADFIVGAVRQVGRRQIEQVQKVSLTAK
ncbi:MAG: PDZ domain-containing protein, partial [Chthoniobacteraceae bacterium]